MTPGLDACGATNPVPESGEPHSHPAASSHLQPTGHEPLTDVLQSPTLPRYFEAHFGGILYTMQG